MRGQELLEIHPSSVLHGIPPAWVVYHDLVYTSKPFMRDITVINPMWLTELAPHYYQYIAPKHGNYSDPNDDDLNNDDDFDDVHMNSTGSRKNRSNRSNRSRDDHEETRDRKHSLDRRRVRGRGGGLSAQEIAALKEAPNSEPHKKHRRLF